MLFCRKVIAFLALQYVIETSISFQFNRYEEQIDKLSSIYVGNFQINWDSSDPYLLIKHKSDLRKVLFQTVPSHPFISIGYATSDSRPIVDGNYKLNEWTLFETPYQSIQNVMLDSTNQSFTIAGEVWGLVTRASYEMKFSIPTDEDNNLLNSQLYFEVNVKSQLGTFNRLFLNYWCHSNENFYGFGTQFTHWNLKSKRIPILVSEQGIGRGAEPLTSLLNMLADRSGGDWSTTYAPKPLYITNYNRSIILDNSEMTFFDTRDDDSVVIEVLGESITGRILFGESMLDLITEITAVTGRMHPLPEWTQRGAIVGLEGGTEEIVDISKRLLNNAIPVKLAGVWIQDWVGLRHAFDGDRLSWNWQLDETYYPRWDELVASLRGKGIRTLSYINPFFSNVEDEFSLSGDGSSRTTMGKKPRNLYQEGVANKYFVKSPMNHDVPYKFHSGSIEFCMLDMTNPAARTWMKSILKDTMVRGTGVSGWMADFGEYLPFDAVLHDGSDGAKNHNLYPQQWAQLNHEAVNEYRAETEGDPQTQVADDLIYFMRSAWIKSPAVTSVFWLGDQLVSWDGHDGIKSVLVGALSSGVGGHSLTHSDIGGYTMQEKDPIRYVRSRELLLRWTELAAFGSALFRSHIGLITSPSNAQIYDDDRTITHFAKFTNIFSFLSDYRSVLMREAHEKGWPLIRQMAAHFAFDDNCWELTSQFMFGADFLIAPVLDPAGNSTFFRSQMNNPASDEWWKDSDNTFPFLELGVAVVKVYIPRHTEWIHLWTGQQVVGGESGRYVNVKAPVGAPPVFYLPHSEHGAKLREFVNKYQMSNVCVNSRCDISDFSEMDWYDWLGIKQFMSVSPI